ncbi:MAG: MFS transporter [Oscillospiraceae bacterium]|nr:MFS transporter [Oscillospiraceae bacterium]
MKLIAKYKLTLFFVIYFLYTFVSNFVHPVTPAFLQMINCSNSMFGFAFAAMALGQFLVSALWGKVGDRIGYAKATAFGFLGYGVSAIIFSMATSWHLVVLGRFIGGIGLASVQVNSMAYIAALDAPAEDRNSLLVIYSSMMGIGGAFGFLVGGLIGDINLYYSFYAQAGVLFAMTAVTYFMVKEHSTFEKVTEKLTMKDINPFTATMASMKLLNVTITVFLVSALLTFFASTGFDQNFNYFLRAKFNFAPSSSGMFKAVVGIISLTINMTINMWLVRKFNISKAMCVTILMAAAALYGVVLAPNQTAVMAFALMYYAAYAMYTPLQQAVMLKNDDDSSKGAVSGLFNAAKSVGMMTGPTFAGLIFDINPNYAFIAFATALVISAAVGYKNYKQLKEKGVYKD